MQLSPDIRPYWLGADSVQIGLDPRISTILEGLSHAEFDFVTRLEPGFGESEIAALAQKMSIGTERLSPILAKLRESGLVLDTEEPGALPTLSRTRERLGDAVAIARADQLGFSIGLGLVRSGVGTVIIEEEDAPTPFLADAFPEAAGIPKAKDAFTTIARRLNPSYSPEGEASVAVQTSSFLADPFEADRFMATRTPHLLAWTEDVDVCVGPFVEPEVTACAECLYRAQMAEDPAWPILAPQALLGHSPEIPPSTLDLAVSLAVRAITTYLDGYGNMLANRQWRVPPIPGAPSVREYVPDPSCGCIGSLMRPDGSLPDQGPDTPAR